jgi:MerR family transcriptional regulator, light-induced transcriptional regulator
MSQLLTEAGYSIAAVSKLTGVTCHALRVWERRYGFPVPHRAPSGHRRYSREQVQLLRRIAELAQEGRAIHDLIADARAGRLGVDYDPEEEDEPVEVRVTALVDRLLAGDLDGSEDCFQRLAEQFGPADLITRVIAPALVDTGERWFRRECEVFQEGFSTGFLRSKLTTMIEAARRANANPTHKILIGTVQGDRHAGGVLILNWMMENVGWRALNLGVDLPVREYQKAVTAWRPDALVLSFVLSRNIRKRFQELSQIRGVPIFVGGRSIVNYQGLARRHGLIPLPGSIEGAVDQLLIAYEGWVRGLIHEPVDAV